MRRVAFAVALLIAGCVRPDWAPVHQQASALSDACARQHAQRVAAVACATPKVRAAYAAAGWPHMDLIDAHWIQLAAIAEKEDRGTVTRTEARGLVAELDVRTQAEISRREEAVRLRRAAAFNSAAESPTMCVPSGTMLRCW